MNRFVYFGALCLVSLATACTPNAQNNVNSGLVAATPVVQSAAALVTAANPKASVVLTSAAQAACQGQAIANLVGNVEASKVLGTACTW